MKIVKTIGISMSITAMAVLSFASIAGAKDFRDKQSYLKNQRQIECLARNVYFESRSESETGKLAVAWVTMNRVEHQKYPDTVCGVVHDAQLDSNGKPRKNRCQFSWYCSGKTPVVHNQTAWNDAVEIATLVYLEEADDPTDGATMFHTRQVSPYWKSSFERQVQIGNHIFYK